MLCGTAAPINPRQDIIEGIGQHGLLKIVLHDRHNLRESQRTRLLEAMENVGNKSVKFLREESWKMSGMFSFIGSGPVPGLMIVECAALETKCLAGELEWKARRVFLAQNPTCVEELLS
jgi:isochorismate synthase EntC